MNKLAIMQPYFFPYLGYWQLINSVDEFVIYDNIQYTKKGWINRNRYLLNDKIQLFNIPLLKGHQSQNVDERFIADDFDKKSLIAKFANAYSKAPYFKENFEIIKMVIDYDEENLFKYLYNSIIKISDYLDVKTKIIVSSSVGVKHKDLKGEKKVIAICKEFQATNYINAIGGQDLYNKKNFEQENINLKFIKMNTITYQQFNKTFIPDLSIIDVMMFNSPQTIKEMLNKYELI